MKYRLYFHVCWENEEEFAVGFLLLLPKIHYFPYSWISPNNTLLKLLYFIFMIFLLDFWIDTFLVILCFRRHGMFMFPPPPPPPPPMCDVMQVNWISVFQNLAWKCIMIYSSGEKIVFNVKMFFYVFACVVKTQDNVTRKINPLTMFSRSTKAAHARRVKGGALCSCGILPAPQRERKFRARSRSALNELYCEG